MTSPSPLTEQDWHIRQFVYEFFIEHERPPRVQESAEHNALPLEQARESYQRLHEHHALVLERDTNNIRMAFPLSAVPTPFRVTIGTKRYWANCAWDSLGIPAMVKQDAIIEAQIPPSLERINYGVRHGSLEGPPAVIHFALPVRQWYDDLVHT